MLLSVPTAPFALSQVAEAEGFGVGLDVVGFGVVVLSHLKSEETSVAPVTVAVSVCDCVGTITEAVPVRLTTTWFAVLPPPPQPEVASAAAAAIPKNCFRTPCHFVPTAPHLALRSWPSPGQCRQKARVLEKLWRMIKTSGSP